MIHQLFINNQSQTIALPFYGRYRVCLIRADFSLSNNSKRVAIIRSQALLNSISNNGIILKCLNDNYLGDDFYFDVQLNGVIDINITDIETGIALDNFTNLILTLKLKSLSD